jgi:hypothetical protein
MKKLMKPLTKRMMFKKKQSGIGPDARFAPDIFGFARSQVMVTIRQEKGSRKDFAPFFISSPAF